MPRPKPIILAILDGLGVSLQKKANPVMHARTPTLDELDRSFPFTTLQASGVAVGLPWGEAGNSEVGHLTIGSGRVIYHHLPRIISSIRDDSFFKNETLLKAIEHVRKNKSRLHIAGLVSSGSVHSYIDHLYALIELVEREKVSPTYIHIFTDGKDAPPEEAASLLANLLKHTERRPDIIYSSVIGRIYSMDREGNWDKTQRAYEHLTQGTGERVASLPEHIAQSYQRGINDTYIEPALVSDENGEPLGRIQENDALILFNFREDSMRQITHAFVDDNLTSFEREKIPNLFVATMTEYQKGLAAEAAFPPLDIRLPLSDILSHAGISHLHIAETVKYAHVTYFFNGGLEKPFSTEKRILIPSLSHASHDETPAMKAAEITQTVLENISTNDVIIVNYANADMVGHSGNFDASIRAVEALDESVAKLTNAILNTDDGILVITSDHGNVELKRNVLTGEKLTEHSLSPVPLYIVGRRFRRKKALTKEEIAEKKAEVNGIITDVAPTILELLQLKKPHEMTGKSLLELLINEERI